jgi:hypothetical protein
MATPPPETMRTFDMRMSSLGMPTLRPSSSRLHGNRVVLAGDESVEDGDMAA